MVTQLSIVRGGCVESSVLRSRGVEVSWGIISTTDAPVGQQSNYGKEAEPEPKGKKGRL